MSLLRLLATGKSLVNVRDTESRYRLTSQRLLPQFGLTRNPFSSPGRAEQPTVAPPRPTAKSGDLSPRAGVGSHTWTLWPKAAGLLSACRQKLSLLIAVRFGKPARPVVLRLPKRPVQGELSLDRIKVMRNDLSDADSEAATVRTKPAPASVVVETAARAEQIWGRVTSRLFPAGKA